MKILRNYCFLLIVCIIIFSFSACGTKAQSEAISETTTSSSAVEDNAYESNSYLTSGYSTTGTDQTVDEIVSELEIKKPDNLGSVILGDYTGLSILCEKETITDNEVEDYLKEYVVPAYKKAMGISESDDSNIELDDSAIKVLFPNYSSLDEFKKDIKDSLEEEARYTNKINEYYSAIGSVIQNSKLNPSEEAIEWQIDYYLKSYYQEVNTYYDGMTLDEVVTLYGTTYLDYRNSLRDYAIESVNQMLVMDAIADKENIDVTEEDISNYAQFHGLTVDVLKETASDSDIYEAVRRELAAQFVVEHSTIQSK